MPRRLYWLSVLLAAVLLPVFAADHLEFGQPDCPTPVLDKKYFVVCHDPERKIPLWVGYALTREDLAAAVANRKEGNFRFRADPELPRGRRAEPSDYSKSGYDQGHMAPAADFTRSVEAMKATFILSNAVPQKPGLNRGQWAQLEAFVREQTEIHGQAWIFTGPVFIGKRPLRTIGANRVAVPTHTFKVILCVSDRGKEMFAFLMPNLDKVKSGLEEHTFSVDLIERYTGLDFFDRLPADEQRRLERVVGKVSKK